MKVVNMTRTTPRIIPHESPTWLEMSFELSDLDIADAELIFDFFSTNITRRLGTSI